MDYWIRAWITRVPGYQIRAFINHGRDGLVYAATNHGIAWVLRRSHLLASADGRNWFLLRKKQLLPSTEGSNYFCGRKQWLPSGEGRDAFLPRRKAIASFCGRKCLPPSAVGSSCFLPEGSNCVHLQNEEIASFRGRKQFASSAE